MNFGHLYRISMYVMLFLATLTLHLDAAADSRMAMLFPLAAAVGGVAAFLTVDRDPRKGLSRGWGNVLGTASIVVAYVEFRVNPDSLVPILGHWLVYLTLIKVFSPKNETDDWYLMLLGLVQVLVGGFLSQSDAAGAVLLAWAVSALWVLSLFYLHRASRRAERDAARAAERQASSFARRRAASERKEGPSSSVPTAGGPEPYPGLVDPAFVVSTLWGAAFTMALGVVIFLVMPRFSTTSRLRRITGAPHQHLTGFSNEVRLGQLGEILENDNVVISVEITDELGGRVVPREELLWRGVTLSQYEDRRWYRERKEEGTFSPSAEDRGSGRKLYRQRIKLESTDNDVLFGLRTVLNITCERNVVPYYNMRDGTLYRREEDVGKGTFEYTVLSDGDAGLPQPEEQRPERFAGGVKRLLAFRGPTASLRPRLRKIALPLVEKIPAEDLRGRCEALETYLRETGGFHYSLQMGSTDADIDPIEDFLVNRRQGHCEYFASALTLLLRSVDIPARMVNGFKGGDWSDLTGVMTVRQKHAHSWVEALVARESTTKAPIWLTLDPTPALERDESVAKVGVVPTRFRNVVDLVRYIWVFYVVGFNAERQERLLYQPARELWSSAREGFGVMRSELAKAWVRLFHFKDVGEFFSVRGFVLSTLAMMLAAAVFYAARAVVRRILRLGADQSREDSATAAGAAFYRRTVRLLTEFGMDRPPAETPREWARRSAAFLGGRGPDTQEVADVPLQVVEAFYRIRFGRFEIAPDALHRLEARLDALEARLRGQPV